MPSGPEKKTTAATPHQKKSAAPTSATVAAPTKATMAAPPKKPQAKKEAGFLESLFARRNINSPSGKGQMYDNSGLNFN